MFNKIQILVRITQSPDVPFVLQVLVTLLLRVDIQFYSEKLEKY